MKRLVLPLALVMAACSEPAPPPPPPPPTPDTTPAEIRDLQVTPAMVGMGGSVAIAFSVSEELQSLAVRVAGRKAECTLEALAATCSVTLSGAEPEGPQPVEVFAMDLAGNPAKATATVTTDYSAPALSIDGRPPVLTNNASPSIVFAADEEGTTFTCATDSGTPAECTSPFVPAGLTEGAHVVYITATDPRGNTSTVAVSFTLDTTAPDTTLVANIPATSRLTAHTVSFSTDDELATFECRLDSAAFATCASPLALSNITEGAHTFEVRAVDEAGNADATPAQVAFTVDLTAPTTSIGGLPADGSRDVSLPFTVSETATTDCAVDGVAFVACTSPYELRGLTDGEHQVLMRSTDAAGNVESPPAMVTVLVDRTPPQTTISSGPQSPTKDTTATFEFTATEPPNTFECNLDGAGFTTCTSPTTVNVTHGEHVFEVRGADAFVNFDLTPARFTWTVDTVAPVVAITTQIPAVHEQPTLTVEFEADEAGGAFECSLDSEPFAACSSPHTITGLTATVGTGTPHVFSVRATDPSGNTGSATSATFDVDLSVPPPGVPEIVPMLPSIISNTTPTIAWNTAANATGYDLEISTTYDFSAGVETQNLTGTSFVVSSLANGKYFYRVRAKNSTGPSAWSTVHTFQVNPWAPVHPLPTSDGIYGIHCRTAAQCVMVGVSGVILRTMDAGKRIDLIAAPIAQTFNDIDAADDDTLVLVGFNNSIMRSTDFGVSWHPITTDAGGNPIPAVTYYGVSFKGSTGIIVGGSATVLVTTDAGATWTVAPKPVASGTFEDGLVLGTAPNHRLLTFTTTAAYYSDDLGQTWTKSASTLASANRPAVAPDGTLFIIGGTRIFRSTDMGVTWTSVNNGGPSMDAGVAIDANTLIVVNASTAPETPVRRATISGTTTTFELATRADIGTTMESGHASMRAIWVDANQNGFMGGLDGAIWQIAGDATGIRFSTPTGVTGNRITATSAGYMKNIQFVDANVGYAVGPGSYTSVSSLGQFLKTINGGKSWTAIDPLPDVTNVIFQDIHFLDAQNGIAVGGATHSPAGTSLANAPFAARTTDGGVTWTQLELPTELHLASKHLRAVAFTTPKIGYAVGDERSSTADTIAFRWSDTLNRFETMPVVDWVDQPVKGFSLFDVKLFDGATGFAVGEGGMYRLDATGGKWVHEYSTGTSSSTNMNAVAFVDANTVVAVGAGGLIYRRSLDAFDVPQWTKIDAPNGATSVLYDVAFYGQDGYIVGAGSNLWVSNDGGLTWSTRTSPVTTGYSIVRKGLNEFFVGALGREIFRAELLR